MNDGQYDWYTGECPKASFYECPEDTVEICSLKKRFVLNQLFKTGLKSKTHWSFQEKLKEYHTFVAKSLLKGAFDYMKVSFGLEKKLSQLHRIKIQEGELNYIHPFSMKFFSCTSAVFHIYKLYIGNGFDLRAVRYKEK